MSAPYPFCPFRSPKRVGYGILVLADLSLLSECGPGKRRLTGRRLAGPGGGDTILWKAVDWRNWPFLHVPLHFRHKMRGAIAPCFPSLLHHARVLTLR